MKSDRPEYSTRLSQHIFKPRPIEATQLRGKRNLSSNDSESIENLISALEKILEFRSYIPGKQRLD